jgi:TetR/AcrR family transcriptional regulator, regulator of cefoperazone and chloramphenicol sensitivity
MNRSFEKPSDQTRSALVEAAIALFGEKGFDATSTRDIATRANANIGSISYHFGSKEGLHRACGEAIAERIRTVAGPALGPDVVMLATADARTALIALFRRLATFMLQSDAAATFVPFLMREMANPGAAFDAIYASMLAPVHAGFCALYAAATGESADTDETKLTVFAAIGQVVYFRIASAAVKRRLGRADYTEQDIETILALIEETITARIDAAIARTKDQSS